MIVARLTGDKVGSVMIVARLTGYKAGSVMIIAHLHLLQSGLCDDCSPS